MKYLALQLHILSKCTHIYVRLVSVLKAKSKKLIVGSFIIVSAFGLAFSPTGLPIHTAQAAVAYDAVSHDGAAAAGDTGSSFNWTHTPSGTPRGVLVYVVQGTTATDEVTSVTYGSLTLTRVGVACDTLTEPGCVYAYFGGYSVPTGAQTVTVNSSGASGKHASAITYTADTDTRVTNLTTLVENLTNPSKSLALFSKTSHVSLGLYSGGGAVTNITPSTNWTSRYEDDFGAFLGGFYTYDIVGSTDVTTGFTQAVDDLAMLAVGISEVDPVDTHMVVQTPGEQLFTVPEGVYEITVKAWGAGGGGGGGGNVAGSLGGGAGGAGGFAQATIPVIPGETLNLTVGVAGPGGAPGIANSAGTGGAGGGRTEVRRSTNSLIIAPGGGGGGGGDDAVTTVGGAGGAGGDTTAGGNGVDASSAGSEANGASGSAGGTGGAGTFNTATAGGLKTAGDGADGLANTADGSSNNALASDDGDGGLLGTNNAGGGGGGGGYYGGGGGGSDTSHGGDGGGGGTSYFASTTSATTSTAGSGVTPGNTGDSDFNSSHAGGGAAGANAAYGADGEHGLLVISYQAEATLNGTLFENDGVTPITSTATVTAVFGEIGYATTTYTNGSGQYSFNFTQSNFTETLATSTPVGGNDYWTSVAYGNGMFVAVGAAVSTSTGGIVMTSSDGINWTEQYPLGNDDAWFDITYGNGTFVAVAPCGLLLGTDCVMTSSDGMSWTVRGTAYFYDYWQAVTYGNGTFVAVSSDSFSDQRAMYSLDNGVTWATTTIAGDNDVWQSVAYGNGTFVAVAGYDSGDPHLVATSPDGITWTARSVAGNDDYWSDVTFGDGKFVAVADSCSDGGSNPRDCVMYSTDGVTWATSTTPNGLDDSWESISYGGGVYTAVGGNGVDSIMISPDAINWEIHTGSDDEILSEVTYGKDRFVAVGVTSVGSSTALTLLGEVTDLSGPVTLYTENTQTVALGTETWIAQSAAGNNDDWDDITYGNGTFVAVGPTGDDRVMTSPDGVTWTPQSAGDDNDFWNATAYGLGTFVAVGGGLEHAMASSDGVTWGTVSAAGDDDYWTSVVYAEGLFVAVASIGDDRVMTSPNGIDWTPRTAAGDDDEWQDVTYGNGTFVAVGTAYGDDLVMTSPDGITWTPQTAADDDDEWYGVAYGNGTFVAVSANFGDTRVMTSPDGVTWTPRDAISEDTNWFDITFGDGLFVAVGGEGYPSVVMTSPDGITWTEQPAVGDDDEWFGIVYAEDTFVAVGSGPDYVMTTTLSRDVTSSGLYANTLTYLNLATTTQNDIDMYQDAVRIHHSEDSGVIDPNATGFSDSSYDSDILFTNDGATTSIGSVTNAVDLIVATTTEFSAPTTLRLYGDFTNTGTLDFAGSTLYLEGTDPTLSGSFVGSNTLGDVVVNPQGGLKNWVMKSTSPSGGAIAYNGSVYVLVGSCAGGESSPGGECIFTSSDGTTWATSTNITEGYWGDVTYGEGIFVAVGTCADPWESTPLDCIMTSSDGVNWATTTSPNGTDELWYSVTYGNGTFVAVGYNITLGSTTAMYSGDGVTWYTPTMPGTDDSWYSVTYGNGLFVAVGDRMNENSNIVMTSPDGIDWTARTAAGDDDDWRGVTYGEGLFVAVGPNCSGGDCVMYSFDGTNWATTTADENNDIWNNVTYGGGNFAAVGFSFNSFGDVDDSIMTSPDGINWTTRGLPLGSFGDAIYVDGNFIAVGNGIAGTEPLTTFATASTSDLTIYENKKLTVDNPLSVAGDLLSDGVFTNNSELYLTGSNKTVTLADPNIGNVIVAGDVEFLSNATTSELTVTSTGSLDPYSALTVIGDFTQGGSLDLSGTKVYLDEVGVVSGNFTGANAFEDVIIDATSWDVQINPAPSDQWLAMAYGNGTFVAVGDCTDEDITCVMTSSDGITWATTSAPDALGGQWRAVTYDNSLFVAVSASSDGDYVMTSPDGINWTGRSLPANFPGNGWSGVAYGSSTFVAVGVECEYADYCVMSSPDGATWTAQSALGDNDYWNDIVYAEGLFVAVGTTDGGGDNSIMTSPDGINWTARSVTGLNEFGWVDVVYGNGVFVATDGFYVMTSPDGITWTESSNDFEGGLGGIAFGEGFFIAPLGYGADGYYVTSPDGITWTTHRSDNLNTGWNMTYGDEMFVTVGRDIFTSSNTTSFQDDVELSDLEILNGSTIVSSSTITLTGNYTNDGTFTATDSEFVLSGAAQQTFAGNMNDSSAFDDLTITNTSEDGETDQSIIFTDAVDTTGTFSMSAGTSAQFPAGSTSTLQSVDLQGTSGNEVYLRSSTADSDWYLDVPGSQIAVEYVNVKDSNASSTVMAINSTDSGNNTNWNFGTGPTAWNATDWTLYDAVTIDHTKVGETLTDFPVYVDLSDLSSQFWSTTPSASSTVGTDIRVTNSSDEELPRELVFASSTAQTGELHFKADSISSTTDTVFKIWYNGNTAGDYATNATYGAENVWTNDFVAVYHMQEDPSGGAGAVLDSTANGLDGTGGTNMVSGDLVAGKLGGKAYNFDNSSNSYINLGSDPLLDNLGINSTSNGMSVCTWYEHDSFAATWPSLMDKGTGGGNGPSLSLNSLGSSVYLYTPEAALTEGSISHSGNWEYLCGAWDGTDGGTGIYMYQDGTYLGQDYTEDNGSTLDDSSFDMYIGNMTGGSNPIDGRMDEFRLSSSTRSADWIAAEYYNQSTTTDFYSIESYPPGFTGSTTISDHDAGQVSNAFSNQNKTNAELFAFKLTPETGTATVTSMVVRLSGAKNISTSDFSNVRLYQDNDNDGNYDPTDTQIDGAGDMTLSGQTGSITFSTDFVLSSTNNYLVVADWNAPSNGAFLKIELLQSGVTATQDEGVQQILGSVTSIQHARNNRGGGGSSSAQIGGAPPASEDVGGGDESGGDEPGEQIGGDPNYKRPTASLGSWSNGERAYNQVDGSYATDNAGATHSYSDANLGVAGGVTIDGVEVRIEVSGTTAAGTIGVQLSWDGGTSWTSSKSTPTLTTSDVVVTLGGPADIWGRTWTVNDFSNANFRIRLTGAPNSNTVRVDEIQVRVYSSVSGGGGGGGGDI